MTKTTLLKALPAALLVTAAGCHGLLEVDNPNNVNVEALTNPASAPNQVNGVLAALTRGANEMVGLTVTASGVSRLPVMNSFISAATAGSGCFVIGSWSATVSTRVV
jgi:hypothetical protein